MPRACNYCGCSEIEVDSARGDAVCTGCGSVLEDNIIVSSVNFQEQSSGASTVVGQFVSDGGRPCLSGPGYSGFMRDSREVTLLTAKRRISELGSKMKLKQHHVEAAFRFFKMALTKNLTRGRKSALIDTACLYLVCRTQGTAHLLLDFSDIQQVNVYALGRAYLRLSSALHIELPALDPCLYIHRFAHKLEFGDTTQEVSVSALRLVSRMKRDWIASGRRPAGLCGAAILMAARSLNFHRTVREVAKVVRVNEQTIRKRMCDFASTPSSSLTINQFMDIDLEKEHDPPSFNIAKKKVKSKKTKKSSKGKSEGSGDEDEDGSEEEEEDEDDVALSNDSLRRRRVSEEDGLEDDPGEVVLNEVRVLPVDDVIARARMEEVFQEVPTAGLAEEDLAGLVYLGDEEHSNQLDHPQVQDGEGDSDENAAVYEENLLDLEGIDDVEIDKMLLNEEEVDAKTTLWMNENGDYLKEMEEKKKRLEEQRSQKEGRKKRQFRKKAKRVGAASSAGEATQKMLVEKRISNKINYDVLKDLMEDNVVTATPTSLKQEEVEEGCSQRRGVLGQRPSEEPLYPVPATTAQYGFEMEESRGDLLNPDLGITRHCGLGAGRLPSVLKQKRPFSATSLPSSYSPAKVSKDAVSSLPKTQPAVRTPVSTATGSGSLANDVSLFDVEGSQHDLDALGLEVVVESGPVELDSEDIIANGGYLDADEDDEEEDAEGYYDDMAYPGDPLMNSDGEEEFY